MCLATMAYRYVYMQHAQYMLLFLVLTVNPDSFKLHALTLAARSYALLMYIYVHLHTCV